MSVRRVDVVRSRRARALPECAGGANILAAPWRPNSDSASLPPAASLVVAWLPRGNARCDVGKSSCSCSRLSLPLERTRFLWTPVWGNEAGRSDGIGDDSAEERSGRGGGDGGR